MTRDDDIFDGLVPHNIEQLAPYQPGKPVEELERELGIQGAIKIASNENPLGPSPLAIEAGQRALRDVHLYPDDGCFHLRHALAEARGVRPEEVVFGAGSNELIGLVVQTFCRPGVDTVVTHKYAFISYRLSAAAHGARFVAVDTTPELRVDVDALIAAFDDTTRVVFLANPNNPTGAHVTRAELERILEALPRRAILVLDEAYHEYAVTLGGDYPRAQDYRAERPLLIALRTFSKAHGLAGLRVGYGIAHPGLVNYLDRVRRPFNVNHVAQAAALAALGDGAHLARSCQHNAAGLAELTAAARSIGVKPYPSLGNFVLVDVGRDALAVNAALQRKGVIVRPMAAWGLATHLRISVATRDETARVTAALADVLG
jgi:histidinol-phosphate aminotransferase